MPFRFLHLADLHLETRFGGREATRSRLRMAAHEAFETAVDLALERELDAVLIAGDTFDDPLLSRRTELAFIRGLRRLAEGGVKTVIACGNHDPGGGGKRMRSLGLDGEDDWRKQIYLLTTARPKVLRLTDRAGVEIAVVVGAGHSTDQEQRNLAENFTPIAAEVPVVGILHTQVHDARGSAEHAPYAPCTRADLAHLGYDYFALGHVHKRQRPFEDVPAWYSGNLQGRNSRERGEKGGLMVELYPGEPARPEFVSLAPVIWDRVRVEDLGACVSAQDLLEHLTRVVDERVTAAAPSEVIVVLELVGTSRAASAVRGLEDRRAFEEDLADAVGALEVQVRADRLRPLRDMAALRAMPSVVSQALDLLDVARNDPQVLAQLAPEQLAGIQEMEPTEYMEGLLDGLEEELLDRTLEDRS